MLEKEIGLRLGIFWSVLTIFALCEYIFPKRKLYIGKNVRWVCNISLIIIDNMIVRLIVPFTAASVAVYAQRNQIGLLHLVSLPLSASVIVSVVLLDLLIYAQHVLFHHVPLFWRVHKVHHIDQEIDVTTGLRFHPVEIVLSTLIKCVAVLLLGIPLMAIILFEIFLNVTSMFNHGNINLPVRLDKFLRLIVVTPDMHRIHHSTIGEETNSNFGFNLPWWDRLFGTYKAQPQKNHAQMEIGLKEYRDVKKTGLLALLLTPFRKNRM